MEPLYVAGLRYATILPGNDIYTVAEDQVVSSRGLLDANGTNDQNTRFRPYGFLHSGTGGLSRYLLSGKEQMEDGVGKLNYFGACYYRSAAEIRLLPDDPKLGRWLTPDPAGQLLNPYVYAGNNPLGYVDPDGEWIWLALAAFLGGRQGYRIGKAQGQSGFDLAFSTLFGASIGFASAGIVSGIEETVTGAVGLETFSGGLATFAGGFASYGVGAAMSGLGMGVLAGSEGRTLWRQTYQSGLSAGGTAGIINWGLYKVSPKFQWSVHKTVLEYAEKQYGMTGRQFYRFQAVNYVAKMQGLPVDRIVYNHSLWSIDNNYVYGAVEPPFYDLGQIGPFSFLGDNGGFDAGHLWATVYHEGQHVLMSRGAEFLSQSHQIINQAISLQEVQIRGLLLQHKYYKYWSDYAHKEIFRGLLDYR